MRGRESLIRTFHREPEYYAVWGPEERPLHWYQYSLEGTRPFRALKLWMSWKHLGSDGFARLIERNVDLARTSRDRARELGFEVEPELAVVCLWFALAGVDDATADELQRAGSNERWRSRAPAAPHDYAPRPERLRAGVINYLSTEDDATGSLEYAGERAQNASSKSSTAEVRPRTATLATSKERSTAANPTSGGTARRARAASPASAT